MKLRYSRRACRDIEAIHSYLSARSVAGARNVAIEIRRAIDYIADNAEGSVPTDIASVHVKWVHGYPYKIFYEATAGAITILHVRHTARDQW